MTYRILLVDDEKRQRNVLASFLEDNHYAVQQAGSGEDAYQKFCHEPPDLIISDMRMTGISGKELLEKTNKKNPNIPFMMITAFANIEDAIEIMKQGAFDYLTKPVNLSELILKIEKAIDHKLICDENASLRDELLHRRVPDRIISRSPLMAEKLGRAKRSARTDVPVLITGPSGTGKELFAKMIHALSNRHQEPFIPINCASLNPGVLESELFGHEKGAFTGAMGSRKGRFELAHKGTLFLDEIGDIPPETQVKLLRILQEGEIERVGGARAIAVDFRLICATHRDLGQLIEKGTFREDLYYRINVVNIHLPPLKDRREDVPPLLEHFTAHFSQKYGIPIKGFSKEAFAQLLAYDYPGNIRELINIVQKATVLARTDVIQLKDIEILSDNQDPDALRLEQLPLPQAVAELEKRMILQALHATGNIQTRAARKLGLNERTLRYKMEKYSILD